MSISTRLLPLRRTGLLVVTILSGMGCYTWRVESLTPEAVLAAGQPTEVRVTRTDGSMIVVRDPVLRADSLTGAISRHGTREDARIPLADVHQIATRQFSAGKTIGLVVGLAAGIYGGYVAVWLIACGSGCD